jgi:peptidoglycan/xylan/chitin deacetylase (PgdA/CDA1 family)
MSSRPHRYALTFDDGPGPQTGELLDLLRHFNQRATFFIVGRRAQKRWPTIARIVDEGHQLAYHGHRHRQVATFGGTIEQLQAAGLLLPRMKQRLYRPPWGLVTHRVMLACALTGWAIGLWDVAVSDWTPRRAPQLYDSLVTSMAPGRAILLHDNHEGGNLYGGCPRNPMLQALEDFFKATGSDFQSVCWHELWPNGWR